MSTWENVLNRHEQIERYMALHDEEVKTRKLVKFLNEGITVDFDIEYLVIRLHDIAREVEQRIGFGELSKDIRNCADRLSDLNKTDQGE
jgi:hypothetical protein